MENKDEEKTPWIKKIRAEISPPSLDDNTADVDRLVRALRSHLHTDGIAVDFSLINGVTKTLRDENYRVQAVLAKDRGLWRLIDVQPAQRDESIYGIAVDLGTSTVVLRLLDIYSGTIQEESSFDNPQNPIGGDILTRIHFAGREGGLKRLQDLIVGRINKEIKEMAEKHGIDSRSIAAMALAGNTTMAHLFMGLDPYWICREPYIPVINKVDLIKARQLGVGINPEGLILVFPNIGSYFGGDLIAGIIASEITRHSEIALFVDVGTNAEVVIGNKDWLMACAGAAGPALEGGIADVGMMAKTGVIDKVRVDPETKELEIGTIEDLPPTGICGSGFIDLVAGLFLSGMIDLRGKFVPEMCGGHLVDIEGIKHFIVVPPEESGTGKALTISQPEIDGLIRSKAAMYTILTTICNTVGVPLQQIERFFVAGTFGSYINPRSAITIGMLPDLPLDRYISLGNTSLEGATIALQSEKAKEKALKIRDQIAYLELNVNQEFMNLFSAAKFIPHTDPSLFPSVQTKRD